MSSHPILRAFIPLTCFLLALPAAASTLVSDLDDTGLAPDAFWNGADGSGGFYSQNVHYNNDYVDWGYGAYSWSGFAASRVNDAATPGYGNQYAVWGDGTDVSGTGTYAVAFVDAAYGVVPTVTLPCPSLVSGFFVNNTAYAALAMRDGEYPARQFSVSNGDWFRLAVTGFDANGMSLGSVHVYLADYREREFLLDRWRWVDLSVLGPTVRTLEFTLDSTDNGTWGMNTPAYFSVDGLEIVPQAASTVATLDALAALPAGQDYWNGADGKGAFRDVAVAFSNVYDNLYQSWYGFALSRVNDPETPGWLNQHAVWGDGTDVSGDGRYAVAYEASWDADADRVIFPYDVRLEGFHVHNTAYAALAMRDGAYPSKKFGGTSGNDADWFKLTVTGKDVAGTTMGTTNIYLADYRFADNSKDYILADWTWVDLSKFRPGVRTLHFALSSSDNGIYGMNTPAYFALDNLTYRYAPGGAQDEDGSLLGRGIPGFVVQDEEDVVNPLFVGWATTVVEYAPAAGVSNEWTTAANALGPVSGGTNLVSLGDLDATQIAAGALPGRLTLGFEALLRDGPGPDFAVFENGFDVLPQWGGGFSADLAYVEVSSDGTHFARFPSASETPAPIGPYGTITSRNVYNLAGKHENADSAYSYGTPFDLAGLAGDPLVRTGLVDLGKIAYVRIVDIPGDGSFLDSRGQPIYDAWPTWGSGGFDLDAVGVIHAVGTETTDRHVALDWMVGRRLVGDPTAAQDLDLDNDGQTAWQEFFAGTDPNDPDSFLRVTGVAASNGTMRVDWQGGSSGSDLDFTLQRRTSLIDGDWTDAEIDVPRTQGNAQSWQGAAPAGDAAFYRVLVKAPDPVVN